LKQSLDESRLKGSLQPLTVSQLAKDATTRNREAHGAGRVDQRHQMCDCDLFARRLLESKTEIMRLRPLLLAILGGLLPCGGARAEDQPFLTLDTTDIEPQLAHEFEQDFNWAIDRSPSTALQMRSELEYGAQDWLQIAGAIDYGWERFGSGADQFHFLDAGGEAIVRLWNVDFDPLGVGVVVAADAGSDLMDIEAKLLLQKNFLNDRLRFVFNSGWTGERQRATSAGNQWEQDSTVELAAGLAYSVTWTWSAGIEFDNDRAFQGLSVDGMEAPDSSVYYAGPTLQYVAHPFTASLGFQAQLPWASGGGDFAGAVRNGFAPDAERYRVALRVARSF